MKAMYACSITVGESVSVRLVCVLFVWCVWYVCYRYGFHLLQCTESCEVSGGLVGGLWAGAQPVHLKGEEG